MADAFMQYGLPAFYRMRQRVAPKQGTRAANANANANATTTTTTATTATTTTTTTTTTQNTHSHTVDSTKLQPAPQWTPNQKLCLPDPRPKRDHRSEPLRGGGHKAW